VTDTDIKDDAEAGNGAPPEPNAEAEAEKEGSASEPAPDPVAEAKAETARIRDQLLRTAADFDNFRKRSRKEIADAEARSKEDLLRELLPVFDNLDRAMQHAGSATSVQSLADGIRMVQRQFVDTLGKLDVVRVDSVGQPFDPAVHEAIQHIETDEHPPGTVAAEARSGYRHGERLLRPALVVVAKAGAPAPPDPPDDAPASESGSESGSESEGS
jgi:molecular chaperone GrpE